MFKSFKQKNRGFTLIEVLVSIFIFSVSITVFMTVLSGGISDINYAKKKMTAEYLAQEGIEYIRNARDNYVLFSGDVANGWSNFMTQVSVCSSSGTDGTGCYITTPDTISNPYNMNNITPLKSCGDFNFGLCPTLSYNSSGNGFFQDGNGDTDFRRTIFVDQMTSDPNQVKVTSIVSWGSGINAHSVSFTEYLFEWVE